MGAVVWHGQRRDWDDLLASFRRNCGECAVGMELCDEHRTVLHDQRALDHLLFARAQKAIYCAREWKR